MSEEVTWHRPFCQLKRFVKAGVPAGPKLLIIAPLSGHYATLLRDTVRAMAPGHDVHITDWHDARDVALAEGPFHLDDYVDYLLDMLRHLGPETHVMAVCQPSVPMLATSALLAAADDPVRPRTLTLMGGPVDTRINPTMPNLYAENHSRDSFERTVVQRVPAGNIGAGRRVYPGFLQLSGFLSMNLDRHVDAHLEIFNQLVKGDGDGLKAHRAFYDEYQAVMDLPADYFLETVERVFQNKDLARGRYRHRGARVRPEAIRDIALMTVEGRRTTSPPSARPRRRRRCAPRCRRTCAPTTCRRASGITAFSTAGAGGARSRPVSPPLSSAIRARGRERRASLLAAKAPGRDERPGMGKPLRRLRQVLSQQDRGYRHRRDPADPGRLPPARPRLVPLRRL